MFHCLFVANIQHFSEIKKYYGEKCPVELAKSDKANVVKDKMSMHPCMLILLIILFSYYS